MLWDARGGGFTMHVNQNIMVKLGDEGYQDDGADAIR